jgi:hypothetical protein
VADLDIGAASIHFRGHGRGRIKASPGSARPNGALG